MTKLERMQLCFFGPVYAASGNDFPDAVKRSLADEHGNLEVPSLHAAAGSVLLIPKPTFVDCVVACKREAEKERARRAAQTFSDVLSNFPGEPITILRGLPEWDWWIDFFKRTGLKFCLQEMLNKGSWTVPCLDPMDVIRYCSSIGLKIGTGISSISQRSA